MRNSTLLVLLVLALLGAPGRAAAGDGRVEINQAKIDAAGGFLYVLSAANGTSYVLRAR